MNRSPERLEFLRDVLDIFISGGTENPVCEMSNIEYVADGNYYTSVRAKFGSEIDNEPWLLVDVNVVARALNRVVRNQVPDVGDRWRSAVLESNRENDAGEIDAPRANNIVCIGLFGEVKYSW